LPHRQGSTPFEPLGLGCSVLTDPFSLRKAVLLFEFIEHTVNVEADSLHEAVAKAVQVFRNKPAPIKAGILQYPGFLWFAIACHGATFELFLRLVLLRMVLPLPIVEDFAFPI
jgi:hypothetical protein